MSNGRMFTRRSALAVLGGLGVLTLASCVPEAESPVPTSTPTRTPTPRAVAEPTVLTHEAGYTQWTLPTQAHRRGEYYFTGITATGEQRVYRRGGQKSHYVAVGRVAADDHGAPAISVAEGHPTLVFMAGHNDAFVTMRSTDDASQIMTGEPSPFSPAKRLPFAHRSTYVQVWRDANRVIVFTRFMTPRTYGWWYVVSDDNGATWSEQRRFFDGKGQQAYMLARESAPGSLTYDVIFQNHPRVQPDKIGYRHVTFDEVFTGQTQELVLDDFETVAQRADFTDVSRIRMNDVTTKNGITYVSIDTYQDTRDTFAYRLGARGVDGTWDFTVFAHPVGVLGTRLVGVPGTTFDTRPGVPRLYYGDKLTSGDWGMISATVAADGTLSHRTVLASAAHPLARPRHDGARLFFLDMAKYRWFQDFAFTYLVVPVPA